MTIWEQTTLAAAELVIDVDILTASDDVITPEEQELRKKVRTVYALAEEMSARQKLARRIASGSTIDHNLRAEMNAVDNVLRQAAIPAQGGSGSHGGKGNGLTYTRKANGSTRLVRRG